jgi:hypothetical protein
VNQGCGVPTMVNLMPRIAAVQWSADNNGNNTAMVFDRALEGNDIIRFGYFWWRYGEFNGELHYIRFAHQIFFPPDGIVTGYGYNVNPGVSGKFHVVWSKLEDNPLKVLEKVISLKLGAGDGLGNLKPDGTLGAPPTVTKLGTNTRKLTRS